MHRSLGLRSTRVLIAALATAGLALAGCGSDTDAVATTRPVAATRPAGTTKPTGTSAAATTEPAATSEPPTPTPTVPASDEPATTGEGSAPADLGASSEYCAAEMDLNTVAGAAGDPDGDPVAFAKAILPLAQAAAALAPASIAPTFTSALAALEDASAGDGSKLDEANQFSDQINEFDAANCPWTKVPVTLENFHFKGIPATLPAGDYVFQLANKGDELHVMVVIRKKPGVTKSFDELLSDPNGDSEVDTVIANGAQPGGSALAIGHLEAGEYLVLCPIPLGSTDPQTEGTGPPHFTVGMQQRLTVT